LLAEDFALFELDGSQKTVGPLAPADFEPMLERICAQQHPYCDIAGVHRRSPMRAAFERALLN